MPRFFSLCFLQKQYTCELLRPVVLFGGPAIQRAKETGEPCNTLERKADTFDEQGMVSLFAYKPRKPAEATARSLPAERRLAVIRLHAEGWSVSSIAEYLNTSWQTVYTTLKWWGEEGVKGLEDKSHTRKAPRVVTFEIANEIRKRQENPLIGKWRMQAVM